MEGIQQFLSKLSLTQAFYGCIAEMRVCNEYTYAVSKVSATLGECRFRFTFPDVHHAFSACYHHPLPPLRAGTPVSFLNLLAIVKLLCYWVNRDKTDSGSYLNCTGR